MRSIASQWRHEDLRAKRQRWVDASHENNFDRGIWNATVEKYADPSHFIFELLQNAEDAGASWVRFSLDPDRIHFEHDGRPFDREDIEGIFASRAFRLERRRGRARGSACRAGTARPAGGNFAAR